MMDIEVARTVPHGLAERGRELWLAETEGRPKDVAREAVLLEACRAADRLDIIDSALHGSAELLRILWTDETELVMKVDSVVVEARQLGIALQRMLSALRRLDTSAPAAKSAAVDADSGPKSTTRDDLARRRAERHAQAAGGES